MLIAISTTKDENLECHSEESSFADDRRISDNGAELSTEILPLHYVQGQNDTILYAFYFQSNDKGC